jgi:hypothetical protein
MKIDNSDIYEQIGNLFYAIAADQHIKPLEIAELKLLVNRDWLPRNTKDSEPMVSSEAHAILVMMDSLQGNNVSPSDAYKEFSAFYALHPEVFSKELKKQIFETASDIVKIFAADNTSGNKHFAELKSMLQLQPLNNV